jgi:hypothetical protein
VVRFRHDRIRHAIMQGLDPRRRQTVQLAIARRLAGVPDLFAVAAEQYLPVVDAVDDEAERRQVVRLIRRAADQARLIGDYVLVNALLGAALQLTDPDETATLVALRTARHAALYSMGHLDEADEEYRTIERLRPGVVPRADARYLQVRSLSHRKRFAEAIGLAIESLCALGIAVPAGGRAGGGSRPAVRTPVPVARPQQQRRRPGPAGDQRPGPPRRDPTDRRGAAGGLLHR